MIAALLLQGLGAIATEQPAPATPWSNEQWSRVATSVDELGVEHVARVWTGGGPDVWLQVDGGTVRLVNTGNTVGTQDEPDVAASFDEDGDADGWDVGFNDRSYVNQWGAYMRVHAARFDLAGAPIGAPFQVNTAPPSSGSCWRPLVTVRADGLTAYLFSGGWGNRGSIRLMDAGGAWLSNDIPYWNTASTQSGQQDPAGCWLPNGRLFVVFCDFNAPGGVELMQRTYDPATASWLALPQRLLAQAQPGSQRFPVCRLGPAGAPWVAWQDSAGAWLWPGSEPPVLLGSGRLPELAPPFVTWEAAHEVWVRDALWPDPTPQRANRFTLGDQERPSIALGSSGVLYVGWHGPSWSNTTPDAYLRPFQVP